MENLAVYLNEQFSLLQNLEFFLRVLIACICGACIGVERSKRFKEAGIRTHVIVCCAAAMMMIVSKYGFADLTTNGVLFNGTRGADAARIAAQVVSGVSFLGAGVIFKNGSTVKGLTTAAGIWATAGIGLAIGCGMYWLGLFGTALIALSQILMHKFQIGADSMTTNRLRLEVSDNVSFAEELDTLLRLWKAKVTESNISMGENGSATYELTLRMSESISVQDMLAILKKNEAVTGISCVMLD